MRGLLIGLAIGLASGAGVASATISTTTEAKVKTIVSQYTAKQAFNLLPTLARRIPLNGKVYSKNIYLSAYIKSYSFTYIAP